ncbi:flavin reductase family protein [Nonomuraea soli]|uniref:Flavin reductase (DIM6/NTAB) family NADH-FMN oxidoreductase RutF n=1 Tax=Nonomuraea soli TaxID=1032476 RepID=A0A7W0HUW5_9ACTN|nr:flavin reductase family protein [Nonomuraea soli]MBA2896618.1 flavin reductase (DIM6/NTAB) family NADH-FMN oxidoreductase RutF [Nonomuraea soli]
MRSLREAFGQFATGVAVVTTVTAQGERAGVTVNSFTSLSLDPPLALWCLSGRAPSVPLFLRAERFAVNVLAADQDHLSQRFATPAADKFAGVELADGAPPLLAGTLASFVCRTVRVHDGGDHHIFVGEVERFQRSGGEPLIFHSGRYRELAHPVGAVA